MNGSTATAFSYLVETLIGLYVAAVLLRLLLQWVRADFYNPLCQFLVKVTNPLLIPLRRVIPGLGGIDFSALVIALVLQMAGIALILVINGMGLPNIGLLLLWALLGKLTTSILIGYLVLGVVTIWLIYRIARGWIYLVDGKEMYPVTTGENHE